MTEEQVQPPQGPQARYGPPAETNGLAVVSLVCGILGVVFPFIPLIFAGRGKRQIDSSGGLQTGRRLAVAGQVLGWVGIALVLVAILGLVALVVVSTGGSVEVGPVRDLR